MHAGDWAESWYPQPGEVGVKLLSPSGKRAYGPGRGKPGGGGESKPGRGARRGGGERRGREEDLERSTEGTGGTPAPPKARPAACRY